MQFIDLRGQTFNRLAVLERASQIGERATWHCRCLCGKQVIAPSDRLKDGTWKSCGCLKLERVSIMNRTHGMSRTGEYNVWCKMNARCSDQSNKDYHLYGGRGIKVCARWRHDFPAFLADMGPRPSRQHSIDRRDNSQGYLPKNCRWATPLQQANNCRSNHLLTLRGTTRTLNEWARELGVPRGRIKSRLSLGWTTEQALTLPKLTKWSRRR